ncbi:MAG TPA: NAD-dependent epimerase/dehydratase family protein [Xanthobacteraceae bacterium]|nr:NAD-dependent epimerase/dehydratase family protein [Xanthobacteraceae bacterium]
MRVLVTGGAGFIGANLVQYLSAGGGYDVVVLDDLSAGQPRPTFPREVRFVRGDFTDRSTMTECLHGVDIVVHLAALSGVVASVEDPRPSFAVNVAGSFQLLEMARAANVRRLINASTGGALLGEVAPPISEQMAPSPLSPYGASKLAVEGYCSAFAGAYGLACATLRFSNVYGPRSAHKTSVVAAFIKNIIRDEPLIVYGDGSQQRDYLYVDDLARGIEACLTRPLTGVYQLGRGEGTTLHTLIATLKKVSGRDFQVRYEPRRSGEVRSTWCDIAKAAREFGYRAPTDLEAGLRETWSWFVKNREIWSRQPALSASD